MPPISVRTSCSVSPAGLPEVVVQSYHRKPFNGLNDLCFDMAGNLTQLAGKIPFPNGIAVDPDQTKLYVSDTGTNSILVWDLAPDGPASNRKTLYRFPDAGVARSRLSRRAF